MIYLIPQNKNQINSFLQVSGVPCNFSQVKAFAEKIEKEFNSNKVKESLRIGAGCSEIWADKNGSYCYTIKRMTGGYWSLISAKGVSNISIQNFTAQLSREIIPSL